MKAITELHAIDFTEFDSDGSVSYENHLKRRKLFGIVIFEKRYRALTSRNRVNLQTGFRK